MELNTFTTILVAIAPALSAVITIFAGIVKIMNLIKKLNQKHLDQETQSNAKLIKAYDTIAKLNTKISSLEKYMLELKESKK